MRKSLPFLTTLFFILQLCPVTAVAGILYAHNGYDGSNGELYRIDTNSQSVTILSDEDERSGPELQMSPDGSIIYMTRYPSGDLSTINASTGITTSTLTLSNYPPIPDAPPTDIITALEFVNGELYGAAVRSGPETGPVFLVTINLATGELTTIGEMTGMNRPAGGMQYLDGVMYVISSTDNNDSRLFTVNLNTGAATLVAPITLATEQQQSASGLTYADGKMYLIMTRGDTNLYSLNPATGALTPEFDLGYEVNSLTSEVSEVSSAAESIPSMSVWGLALLAGLLGFFGIKRRIAN